MENSTTTLQKSLPNSTLVLILGICSILTCCCYGLVGIICGIITLVLANKDQIAYLTNPEEYTLSSYNNLKAGRIMAIVGLVLSFLYLLYVIVVFFMYGAIGLGVLDEVL
jgi:M penetrans paralogue family 26